MNKQFYEVEITETVTHRILVQADDRREAIDLATWAHDNSMIMAPDTTKSRSIQPTLIAEEN